MSKKENVIEEVKIENISDADIDQIAVKTGKILESDGKVKIKIPKDPLNKEDVTVPVCINGYFYYIKRGESVEVPEVVADVLENAGYI